MSKEIRIEVPDNWARTTVRWLLISIALTFAIYEGTRERETQKDLATTNTGSMIKVKRGEMLAAPNPITIMETSGGMCPLPPSPKPIPQQKTTKRRSRSKSTSS